ncbi:membrane protein [Mycolicibacterium madagascariense]|uniref:Membrane protein n=1 Tax=Mycolicibacterium madagascariense TaxID=212765 RepID=A0A7I7XF71_9MYCO|nr:HNH endonuclease family protein [Mycolicibacterium madagascariense]MCV7013661.1 HNH endonuclease [Mycolicibacterium madagascariense]BBZ27823.1 membrane protein [Mycolicibacterium madagascariense]
MRRTVYAVAAVAVAILVAVQVTSDRHRSDPAVAGAEVPTVAVGADVLAGIAVIPERIHDHDYRRAAFGDAWTDDTSAPGGHDGCDTRDDVLNRDLVDKTFTSTARCPTAVATGTLHDPYTNAVIHFTRGNQTGASVQIDHIVPLALAWDLGARAWPADERTRFANDPANLLAVQGRANQDKGDKEPANWMPPNHAFWCQYAVQFAAVLRGYALPVDERSATKLRAAAATCPTG